jgi:hypothetical protein
MDDARQEANRQVVRGFCTAINQRRVERLHEFMADDVVDHDKIIHGEVDEPGAAFGRSTWRGPRRPPTRWGWRCRAWRPRR